MVTGRSPTITTLTVFVVVFLLEWIALPLGLFGTLFVLTPPASVDPWTLVTSVYAHATLQHLLVNSVGLLLTGVVLERATTRLRYHAFFVTTGALAGLAQITVGTALGSGSGVLGASGAIFAFMGYLLTGNRLTDTVVVGVSLSGRVQLLVFLVIAAVVTLTTGSARAALIAHFTGLFVGLLAGRAHLLRADRSRSI
ncbi:rhomboid family intramembrane serine protease [Halorientalis sp. IM1011]|uniref:rhomboid family intramembrane serine protease n=1 Tax=Halorientalis sp. IM1011 TaxID=1932360 RepID=UPI00097CC2AA|nr:rhomboid family intramembrane serine protease [Halorientalis sp. IM1011]AQL43772.1 rhomboid family intramembrane serine protease [Halorientalis sp. IM1011]